MATKVRDYAKLAQDIITITGGEENIVSVTHCATRLRMVLKETPADAKKKISGLPGVVSVIEKGGQFQVVIGTHVTDVYAASAEILHLDNKTSGNTEAPKMGIMNRIIAAMSACMSPSIYLLAACGLLQGVMIILTAAFPAFKETGTYSVLNFMSWTSFTFLPVLIAVAGSKYFKCNTYVAVLCCCALVNPSWGEIAARIAGGEEIRFLFFKLAETTYTSSFLPPIILLVVLAQLERFLNKVLPDILKAIFTPLLCFLIMVPATLVVIGPITSALAHGIADAYGIFYNAVPQVAAAVFGGLWECLVVFGVHWTFTPIVLADYEFYGRCALQNLFAIAACCQMAACFAVWFKSKNRDMKVTALSAGLTGIFGITEPAIYGVTLPLKKPFISACIGGAAGSVIASIFHSYYYAYAGLAGVLTIPNAYNQGNPSSIYGAVIGTLGGMAVTFVLVQVLGFQDPADDTQMNADGSLLFDAPLTGTCIPLSMVDDPTFSEGVLGEGIAIRPSGGKLYAPVDGTVAVLADTGHAIGICTGNGAELFMHIGLDTVTLNGKPFSAKVAVGTQVKKGDVLMEVDWDAIRSAGLDTVTPILITNKGEFRKLDVVTEYKDMVHGTPIMKLV